MIELSEEGSAALSVTTGLAGGTGVVASVALPAATSTAKGGDTTVGIARAAVVADITGCSTVLPPIDSLARSSGLVLATMAGATRMPVLP